MGTLKQEPGERRVLVTGATGAAGPALVDLLLEKGYDVRIFSRHCLGSDRFTGRVERFQGDLLDRRAVSTALEGVDFVFHLAAKLHDTSGRSQDDEYRRTNVEGTEILVNEARAAGVTRFVFFSTINVYGLSLGNQRFDETSPVAPRDPYSRSKLEAERMVLCAGRRGGEGGFSVVVLRVAAVYGKQMKGNYKTLAFYLKKGGFLLFGDGGNKRTLVYDRDLAEAALLALEHPRARGNIYNVTDGAIHSFNEIVSSLCRVFGRKNRFLKVPASFMRSISCLGKLPGLSRFFRMAGKQMESLAVSGEKVQRELGFVPGYGLSRGWRETLGINER
ncbi:MAG: NAD-dependent epimerase/dehydratase family protein [Desulfobacteraceae bacterium]|nr:NAD-dependent epimerase/dehydratase family protein [Desulfobacteraceae bacterium]